MNHVDIKEEIVNQLVEGCSWGKLGFEPTVEKLDESSDPVEQEVIEEAVTCPLCESHLDEEISDEKLSEHLETVLGIDQVLVEELEGDEYAESIDEEADEDEAQVAHSEE